MYLLVAVIFFVLKSIKQTLQTDSEILSKITAYVVRSSFWAVLIVGVADFLISFMVVEKLVEPIFGEQVKINLVIPAFRITYIHFPLILAFFCNWLFYKICRVYLVSSFSCWK